MAAVLVTVTDDIKKTYDSVAAVVAQLDTTMAQLKDDAGKEANATAAAAAAAAVTTSSREGVGDSGTGGAGNTDRVSSLATELGKALGTFSGVAETVAAGERRWRDDTKYLSKCLPSPIWVMNPPSYPFC